MNVSRGAVRLAFVVAVALGLEAAPSHSVEATTERGPVLGEQGAAGGATSAAVRLREQAEQRYVAGLTEDADTGKLFQQAAEAGDPLAAMWVARLTRSGRAGIPKNQARAAELVQAALPSVRRLAAEGDPAAKYLLGMAYFEAFGVAKDDRQAFAWLLAAAEGGNVLSMGNVAILLLLGVGTDKNGEAAFAWSSKAADRGHVDALRLLGYSYHWGVGVKPDLGRALGYYRRAQAAGVDTSSTLGLLTRGRQHPFSVEDVRGLPYVKLLGIPRQELSAAAAAEGLLPGSARIVESAVRRTAYEAALACPEEGLWFGISEGKVHIVELSAPGATASAPFKGRLPVNLTWEDTVEVVRSKLGLPDGEGGVERDDAFGMSYFVDNLSLTVLFSHDEKRRMRIVRIFERWPADAEGVAALDVP